jgi:hypothetical protein
MLFFPSEKFGGSSGGSRGLAKLLLWICNRGRNGFDGDVDAPGLRAEALNLVKTGNQ